MNNTGVIEGFFGPQWPLEDRKSYAAFLAKYGGDFFIYAPKQDPHLRKKWREAWDESYLAHLRDLVSIFHQHGIKFGVGFSPFGLGETLTLDDKTHLEEKLGMMNSLGIDMLGLFFDDMPTNANLAKTQIEALNLIKRNFSRKIVFCPSYYTPDPILDKVFGQRPENYLEDLAVGVSQDVSIAWTGPKVISPEISSDHLKEVSLLLKRKPFIWENLFANDGPKNCKFLKLKPFSGRDNKTFDESEAFGFNLMNQAELSKILFLASKYVLEGQEGQAAFEAALSEMCSPDLKQFILKNRETFLSTGLDNIATESKEALIQELRMFHERAGEEIRTWLQGDYNVGSECLTD
jgi:hyaluronoglucosaminidase